MQPVIRRLSFIPCLLLFVLYSCKPEYPDAEPLFQVSFFYADSTAPLKNNFERVYGLKDNAPLKEIHYDTSENFILLPLNIRSGKSTFVFRKDSIQDTLFLSYKTRIVHNERYKIEQARVQPSTTFDSLRVICQEKHNECPHVEELYIYY